MRATPEALRKKSYHRKEQMKEDGIFIPIEVLNDNPILAQVLFTMIGQMGLDFELNGIIKKKKNEQHTN